MSDLDDALDALWTALEASANQGRHAFSMVSVATVADGAPRLRTVVLRRVDRAASVIGFNTDTRSPKFAELEAEPRASVVAYDAETGVQARLEGRARLLTGAAARPAWDQSAAQSRICYRHVYPPGAFLEDPTAGDPTPEMIGPEDPETGVGNFCAVEIALDHVEWLDLAAGGHRRAAFGREGGEWRGRWIAP